MCLHTDAEQTQTQYSHPHVHFYTQWHVTWGWSPSIEPLAMNFLILYRLWAWLTWSHLFEWLQKKLLTFSVENKTDSSSQLNFAHQTPENIHSLSLACSMIWYDYRYKSQILGSGSHSEPGLVSWTSTSEIQREAMRNKWPHCIEEQIKRLREQMSTPSPSLGF